MAVQAELFVMGKPQLGETLLFEMPAPMATMGFLLVDTAPGPTPIGPVVLDVGIAIAAPRFMEADIPNEPTLAGLHVWGPLRPLGPSHGWTRG